MMSDTKIKAVYMAAFAGAKTAKGGEVLIGSGIHSCDGLTLLRVGDVATYPDGSTAVIVAGAGNAMKVENIPVAVVGSPLSNGDTIVSSPITPLEFHELDGAPIFGLLDPSYQSAGA